MFMYQNLFTKTTKIYKPQQRSIFAFLNFIFNRVSKSRIKEVGPNRACAEWLMRNGAHIKWKGNDNFVLHYNSLPLDPTITGSFIISHVKAHNSSINSVGFPHFNGCNEIVSMEFHKCSFFDDKCIDLLSAVRGSLHDLSITSCHEVTDRGLQELLKLENLNKLVLGDLPNVKYMKIFSKDLETTLPNCRLELPLRPAPEELSRMVEPDILKKGSNAMQQQDVSGYGDHQQQRINEPHHEQQHPSQEQSPQQLYEQQLQQYQQQIQQQQYYHEQTQQHQQYQVYQQQSHPQQPQASHQEQAQPQQNQAYQQHPPSHDHQPEKMQEQQPQIQQQQTQPEQPPPQQQAAQPEPPPPQQQPIQPEQDKWSLTEPYQQTPSPRLDRPETFQQAPQQPSQQPQETPQQKQQPPHKQTQSPYP